MEKNNIIMQDTIDNVFTKTKKLEKENKKLKQQRDELVTVGENLIEDYEKGRTVEYSVEALMRTIEGIKK